VIVTRNDTLDRIFRRLKLNLADLASLRSLPGLRARLDSLRPGEALHFTHKDGALFGLERRLNESQTLKVSREPTGLKADVLQNPLETRSRTARGVIDRSLFEAVEAAGANDQTAVALADIFGWTSTSCWTCGPGMPSSSPTTRSSADGAYVKDGPIQAAAFVNQGREFRAVRYTDAGGGSHYYTPDAEAAEGVPARAGGLHARQLGASIRALPPDPERASALTRGSTTPPHGHAGARRGRWAHPLRRPQGGFET